MKKISLLPLLIVITPSLSLANISGWSGGFSHGYYEYVIESPSGNMLDFSCDAGAKNGDSDNVGDKTIYLTGKNINFDSDKDRIEIRLGPDSFTMENIGTSIGDSNWYGFWDDLSDTDEKTLDVYVNGKKIDSFSTKKAGKVLDRSPNNGCLKPKV